MSGGLRGLGPMKRGPNMEKWHATALLARQNTE